MGKVNRGAKFFFDKKKVEKNGGGDFFYQEKGAKTVFRLRKMEFLVFT